MKSSGIVVNGHRGTWYVIDEAIHQGEKVYLLEHETYGDEASCVIVNNDGELLMDDVMNGFLDL